MKINWAISIALWVVSVLASAQPYQNIKIFEAAEGQYPPCEPSISVMPENPALITAGAVLDYVFFSNDSGQTWQVDRMISDLGVYGDPCIVSAENQFHYFHLSSPSGEGWANSDILDQIVCQSRSVNQESWTKGVGIGLNPPKDQDKEWAIWDPINEQLVVTWTQFDEYGSAHESCKSSILFATSPNGKEWSEAQTISETSGHCIDNSGTTEGAVPAVDPKGNIHISWSLNGKLYYRKIQEDRMNEERVIVEQGANWDFSVPGLGRANGMPITLCDLSEGPNRGAVYVNWADQRNGEDDTDIWLIKSTDGGKTWSDPTRVNDDPPGRHQFFTWMTIDQSTGFLYAIFYDRRNHEDEATDVFLAVSKDGGNTFENQLLSEASFYPPEKIFFGDYNNISAAGGVVRPIWTHHADGKLSIWTAIINE